jgi:hypothetical protein
VSVPIVCVQPLAPPNSPRTRARWEATNTIATGSAAGLGAAFLSQFGRERFAREAMDHPHLLHLRLGRLRVGKRQPVACRYRPASSTDDRHDRNARRYDKYSAHDHR